MKDQTNLEPIAIVGLGCRFPGAANPDGFLRLLRDNLDAIVDVPADRWDAGAIYHPERDVPGRTYARRGGFLNQVDQFDAQFFGISPREAASMDPQIRLMLEVAAETFDDAGFDRARDAARTGVYVGISGSDYQDILLADRKEIDGYAATGTAMSIAANRISHAFDLHGPSMAVDTACSSSLVAVHLACTSLRTGETDVALAGGVCLLLRPEMTIGFSKGFMLSPDARCKAFDAAGNGFVRGEGAGAVLLKRVSDAVRDGDTIYAVILGTNVNQDGHTPTGIAVPNPKAQKQSLRDAYRKAGVHPAEVHYVEAHGPGTPVGDPIEATALGEVLGAGRAPDDALVLGSVKTNIGHLEPAAGIAGLIKTTLGLANELVFANLHFETPNPSIDFGGLALRVARCNEPWPIDPSRRRIAGVNSFGFGGTNAHVVLGGAELARADRAAPAPSPAPRVLALSARTSDGLLAEARSLAAWLGERGAHARLDDICHTAAVRREHHEHRLVAVAHDHAQLAGDLAGWAAGEASSRVTSGTAPPRRPRVGFVFCGMGSHWWGMGQELLRTQPAFREAIVACDAAMRPLVGWSLLEELSRDEATSRLMRFDVGQPAMFAIQVGLTALWRSLGVEPDAIVGHSVGEVAAAYAAGALSLADAARVVVERSRLQVTTQGKGRLLALGLADADVLPYLAGREHAVSIAAVNGPATTTLAGDPDVLAAIAHELEPSGVFCKFLRADVPAHSPAMEPLRGPLVEALAQVSPCIATTALYSTVTGARVDGAALDAAYWGANLREPVRFAQAVRQMLADDIELFVEISPHPVLAGAITETVAAAGRASATLPSLRRAEPEVDRVTETLASLHVRGARIQWAACAPGRLTSLPPRAWQRQRHWKEAEVSRQARHPVRTAPVLGVRTPEASPCWELEIEPHAFRYMYDHCVQGAVIWPAAGFVEMALEAATAIHGEGHAFVLRDIALHRALVMPAGELVTARVTLDTQRGFAVHARGAGGAEWMLHAAGRFELGSAGAAPRTDLADVRRRCAPTDARDELYAKLVRMGDQFGPVFCSVHQLALGEGECVARIVMPAELEDQPGVVLHPVLLDGCFQTIVANLPREAEGSALPVRIRELRVLGAAARGPVYAHARLGRLDAGGFAGDVTITDADGRVLVEVYGFEFQSLESTEHHERAPLLHASAWQLTDAEPAPAPWRSFAAAGPQLSVIASQLGREHGRDRHYQRVRPALDALATAYAAEALDQLGDDAAVAPAHRRVLARMRDHVRRSPLRGTRAADQHAALVASLPDYAAELSLLGRCGRELAAVLRGEQAPLGLVFPEGSVGELEHLYATAPTAHVYNRILREALGALVDPARPRGLSVLEVGAGTCGTTVHLLDGLAPHIAEYVVTDVSPAFLRRAASRFARHPFVRYAELDLERDPGEQGIPAAAYDLIVAADVVHATSDVQQTIGRLARALRPGGVLALVELTNPPFWPDVTFGLLDGWWAFRDRELRPDHALLDVSAWQRVLAGAGLEVVVLGDHPELAGAEQTVLLARAPLAAMTPPATRALAGPWCVLGRDDAFTRELRAQLAALGGAPQRAYDRTTHGIVVVADDAAPDGACAATQELVALARTLSRDEITARLCIVSRGAQAVHATERTAIAPAALWGLGRVIANEHPEWRCVMLDVDAACPDIAARVAAELAREPEDDEIALRREGRYVRRWRRLVERAAPDDTGRERGVPPGFVRVSAELIGRGAPAFAPTELVGRVAAVGEGVTDVASGEQVVAICVDAPTAGSVLVPIEHVVKLPVALAASRAAAGTAAFACLDRLLRGEAGAAPGETMWIHGAGEELRAAALRTARARGLEAVASVDTDALRATPMRDRLVDARSVRLGDDVRDALGGRAVDAVLLLAPLPAGTTLRGVLAPGARVWFAPGALHGAGLELERRVTLAPFDPRALLARDRETRRTLGYVLDELASGRLDALPHRILVGDDAGADTAPLKPLVVPHAPTGVPITPNGTYLVTGGLGGLGLTLARHLAARGARRIVLAGRRGAATPEARDAVAELERDGVEVLVAAADVTRRADVARLLELARDPDRPLRGVVHAAMVLEDSTVAQLDDARVARVVAPKVDGAVLLDELTRCDALDFFVLFSSFASIVGNPGQGAYAAANAALDALAARRRAEGLPAVSISWGSVAGAGYVAAHADIDAHLQRLGITPFSAARAMQQLDRAIDSGRAHLAVIDVDWSRWCAVHPCGSRPRFAELRASDAIEAAAAPVADDTVARSPLDVLRAEVARALRMQAADLAADVPLTRMGFDSLMAVELRTLARERLGVDIPAMRIMGGPTLRELADYVESQRDERRQAATTQPATTAAPRAESWLVCTRASAAPRLRLFCVPYNGGSIASYAAWSALLPDDVELWTVQLPGQMDRKGEAPPAALVEWARGLAGAMAPLLDRPYAVYGHSLGGLVAFELVRELRRRGARLPRSLFVGAVQGAHLPDPFPATDRLTDHDTLRRLGMFDALAPLLRDERMVDELRPIIQTGIDLLKQYRCDDEAPLTCPIVALGGATDAVVLDEHLLGWRGHCTHGFERIVIQGGHLFHQERTPDVVEALVARLADGAPARRTA